MLNVVLSISFTIENKNKKVKSKEEKKLPEESLTEVIKAVQAENYQAECYAIVKAPLLTHQEYHNLKKSPLKTPQQRHSLRKYALKERYSIPVTVKLISQDDQGWYQKIRLHYFLTLGRPYLTDRDALVAQKILLQGNGQLFLPDFNISQLGASIGVLEILGLPPLLQDFSREFSNQERDLKAMAQLALQHRQEIKTVTGITIAKTATPIVILRQVLSSIGHSLNYVCCRGSGQKRLRIYQIAEPQDGRQKVFAQWIRHDLSSPGSSEPDLLEEYENFSSTRLLKSLSVQLELNF